MLQCYTSRVAVELSLCDGVEAWFVEEKKLGVPENGVTNKQVVWCDGDGEGERETETELMSSHHNKTTRKKYRAVATRKVDERKRVDLFVW